MDHFIHEKDECTTTRHMSMYSDMHIAASVLDICLRMWSCRLGTHAVSRTGPCDLAGLEPEPDRLDSVGSPRPGVGLDWIGVA
jgi:hypothetical protein